MLAYIIASIVCISSQCVLVPGITPQYHVER